MLVGNANSGKWPRSERSYAERHLLGAICTAQWLRRKDCLGVGQTNNVAKVCHLAWRPISVVGGQRVAGGDLGEGEHRGRAVLVSASAGMKIVSRGFPFA